LRATIFGGTVGREDVDIVIQASPKGEVTGASLRFPYPTGVLPQDLLAHGANPDYENKHSGGSAIDWASRTHQSTMLRLLLAAQKPMGH
jgi:hypothetical protein